jgi:uncharacterized membrane protein
MLPIALIAFSGLGVMLSVRTLLKMRPGDAVLGSPDARVFGFPNASISLAYFAALIVFGALRWAKVPVPLWLALAASALSVLMSIYLATRLVRLRRF